MDGFMDELTVIIKWVVQTNRDEQTVTSRSFSVVWCGLKGQHYTIYNIALL